MKNLLEKVKNILSFGSSKQLVVDDFLPKHSLSEDEESPVVSGKQAVADDPMPKPTSSQDKKSPIVSTTSKGLDFVESEDDFLMSRWPSMSNAQKMALGLASISTDDQLLSVTKQQALSCRGIGQGKWRIILGLKEELSAIRLGCGDSQNPTHPGDIQSSTVTMISDINFIKSRLPSMSNAQKMALGLASISTDEQLLSITEQQALSSRGVGVGKWYLISELKQQLLEQINLEQIAADSPWLKVSDLGLDGSFVRSLTPVYRFSLSAYGIYNDQSLLGITEHQLRDLKVSGCVPWHTVDELKIEYISWCELIKEQAGLIHESLWVDQRWDELFLLPDIADKSQSKIGKSGVITVGHLLKKITETTDGGWSHSCSRQLIIAIAWIAQQKTATDYIDYLKSILTERQRFVLGLRSQGKSYGEIGATIGLSRERVRQIIRDTRDTRGGRIPQYAEVIGRRITALALEDKGSLIAPTAAIKFIALVLDIDVRKERSIVDEIQSHLQVVRGVIRKEKWWGVDPVELRRMHEVEVLATSAPKDTLVKFFSETISNSAGRICHIRAQNTQGWRVHESVYAAGGPVLLHDLAGMAGLPFETSSNKVTVHRLIAKDRYVISCGRGVVVHLDHLSLTKDEIFIILGICHERLMHEKSAIQAADLLALVQSTEHGPFAVLNAYTLKSLMGTDTRFKIIKGGNRVANAKTFEPGSILLKNLFPGIAVEWHPTKNKNVLLEQALPYSSKRVYWQCKQGHEWEEIINQRTIHGTRCSRCVGVQGANKEGEEGVEDFLQRLLNKKAKR